MLIESLLCYCYILEVRQVITKVLNKLASTSLEYRALYIRSRVSTLR